MQWRRSDAVGIAAYLGLRDAGWFVRAILPCAVAAIDGKAETPHLGRGGLLHPHIGDGLSYAVRPPAAYAQARRLRSRVGRLRRPRRVRRTTRGSVGRKRDRRHFG